MNSVSFGNSLKKYLAMYAHGPDLLGATGSIYTEHPQKVRSSQCGTKQVDRKSSMDRTGRVGSPGVTDDYPPTISKKYRSDQESGPIQAAADRDRPEDFAQIAG